MKNLQPNINDRGEIQNIIFKLESLKTAIDLKEESEALTPEDQRRLSDARYDIKEAIDKVNRIEETLKPSEELFYVYIPRDDQSTRIGYVYAETICKAYQKLEIIGDEPRGFGKLRGESSAKFYAGSIYMKIDKFAGIHRQLLESYEDLSVVAINETKAYDRYLNGYNEAKDRASESLSGN